MTEDAVTAWLMEATYVALDSDDKAQVKDNSEEEAADRMDGGNGLYNNFVVAADKGDGGGDSRAKEAPG